MEMAQMNVQKPARKSVIDMEIVFECLHEVYGRESSLLLSDKDVRTTMVYPFLKMLTSQCRGFPSKRQDRYNLVIVAGIHINLSICKREQPGNLRYAAACLLHAYDVFRILT